MVKVTGSLGGLEYRKTSREAEATVKKATVKKATVKKSIAATRKSATKAPAKAPATRSQWMPVWEADPRSGNPSADYNRQAGRTTATLRNAVDVLLQGKNVAYITLSVDHSKVLSQIAFEHLQTVLMDTDGEYKLGHTGQAVISNVSRGKGQSLRFVSLRQVALGNLRGRYEVVIPDHLAYESVSEENLSLRGKNVAMIREREEIQRRVVEIQTSLSRFQDYLAQCTPIPLESSDGNVRAPLREVCA
jgi:hypothetical protein